MFVVCCGEHVPVPDKEGVPLCTDFRRTHTPPTSCLTHTPPTSCLTHTPPTSCHTHYPYILPHTHYPYILSHNYSGSELAHDKTQRLLSGRQSTMAAIVHSFTAPPPPQSLLGWEDRDHHTHLLDSVPFAVVNVHDVSADHYPKRPP